MSSVERIAKKVVPVPVKDGAKRALRGLAVGTSPVRQLPDFLIIGTKRGGTTSMWRYLLRHPLVAPMFPATQNIKSPHFFDLHYDNGVAWYRSHFPSAAYRRRVQRQLGRAPVAGEASPYYLFHPRAAERAAEVVPDAKVIVLLRNPVERAWSHYWERVNAGTEPLSFEEAIEREPSRLAGEVERILADPRYTSPAHDHFSYLARGRYLEQLEPWLQRFPRERICILRSEDFYADPQKVYNQVLEFLGLPSAELDASRRYSVVPTSVRRVERMDEATRRRLVEWYAVHNRRLEAALGMELCWS
jgi:Sulfotransferase domain